MADLCNIVDNKSERIVVITSAEEANFARKFMIKMVSVNYNDKYTAFAIDDSTVFVYPNLQRRDNIIEIFQATDLTKLISKPLSAVKLYLKGSNCNNCEHISAYISKKGNPRIIPDMKKEIIDQNMVESLSDRAAKVALIIMKYKIDADKTIKPVKKSLFNKKRDCYLIYLTAYNDILSTYGPLRFTELTRKVRDYPYLCRMRLHPALALEGLISVGALSNDPTTTLISIPDQIP